MRLPAALALLLAAQAAEIPSPTAVPAQPAPALVRTASVCIACGLPMDDAAPAESRAPVLPTLGDEPSTAG